MQYQGGRLTPPKSKYLEVANEYEIALNTEEKFSSSEHVKNEEVKVSIEPKQLLFTQEQQDQVPSLKIAIEQNKQDNQVTPRKSDQFISPTETSNQSKKVSKIVVIPTFPSLVSPINIIPDMVQAEQQSPQFSVGGKNGQTFDLRRKSDEINYVNDPRSSGFGSSGLNGRTLDSTMLMQNENSNVQNSITKQNAPQNTSQNVP